MKNSRQIHQLRKVENTKLQLWRKVTSKEKNEEAPIHAKEDSSSDSSSELSRSEPSEVDRGSKLQEEDEAVNACFIGREDKNDGCLEAIESNRHLGERELKGNGHVMENPNNYNQLSGEGNRVLEQAERLQVPLREKVESRADVFAKGIEGNVSHDDIMVGLEFEGSTGPMCAKSTWEASVDELNSAGRSGGKWVQVVAKLQGEFILWVCS
ncbi:hypothetical protein V6N12_023999 [Hibiscus sabdariffa]|uniref:Uncharacterized protein n=1 Tax=Hibiscus sabdariffa TaxID=183260 RepID=A0ABR2FZB2_9ROSI